MSRVLNGVLSSCPWPPATLAPSPPPPSPNRRHSRRRLHHRLRRQRARPGGGRGGGRERRKRAVSVRKGRVTNLGTLGGDYSEARAINRPARWQARRKAQTAAGAPSSTTARAGCATSAHWAGRAASARRSTMPGMSQVMRTTSMATTAPSCTAATGAMTDLGTLGGKISYAAGVNNAGQVVGTAALSSNYRRASSGIPAGHGRPRHPGRALQLGHGDQ